MNVPRLRFKEFSGAWEIKTLSYVCNKIMDGTHFSPKSTEGAKKYLTSKNIRNTGLDISNCNYISEKEHQEIYKKCPVKLGDVLLTKDVLILEIVALTLYKKNLVFYQVLLF